MDLTDPTEHQTLEEEEVVLDQTTTLLLVAMADQALLLSVIVCHKSLHS